MDEIILWLSLFAAYLKTDPVYSFILDAFPLMIVSTFGAMIEQLDSNTEITGRKTIASIMSAMAVAIVTNVIAREWTIRIHLQIFIALCAGLKGRMFLEVVSEKVLIWIKKTNG